MPAPAERMTGIARLTPAFTLPCLGSVHSVFDRTANVMMETGRMLTLTSGGLPRLPDSVCLPREALARLCAGQPAECSGAMLRIGNHSFSLVHDSEWNGFLSRQTGMPLGKQLLQLAQNHPGGLHLLPARRVQKALADLCTPNAPQWLGLGPGLTPSYDDALVGVMAVCRAAGITPPFRLTDLSGTTDVSARYLQLAQEGYFGEPVLSVIYALCGRGDLQPAAEHLAEVGATSGCDMLMGMAQAWLHLIKPHERHEEEQHGTF